MSIEYFKSKDVTIFPCANRVDHIDPQASSINEVSITKLCGMGQTHIISNKAEKDDASAEGDTPVSGEIELTINGYYFKINLTSCLLTGKQFAIATTRPTTTTITHSTKADGTDGTTTSEESFEVAVPTKLVQLLGYNSSSTVEIDSKQNGEWYCNAIALVDASSSLPENDAVSYHILKADGPAISGFVSVLENAEQYTDSAKSEIVGTLEDDKTKNTIHGVRAYTDQAAGAAVVTVEATPGDHSQVYVVKQNGEQIATINVPIDRSVNEGAVFEDEEKGTCIKLVLADNSEILIPVSALFVTGSDSDEDEIKIIVDPKTHVATATINNTSISKGKLDDEVQEYLDNAIQSLTILGNTLNKDNTALTTETAKTILGLDNYADKETTAIAIGDLVDTIGAPANLEGGTTATGIYKAIADAEAAAKAYADTNDDDTVYNDTEVRGIISDVADRVIVLEVLLGDETVGLVKDITDNTHDIADEADAREHGDADTLDSAKDYTDEEINGLKISIEKKTIDGVASDYIIIKNKDDEEVAYADASAFVKDSFLDDIKYEPTTGDITFSFTDNSDEKSDIIINVKGLVDTYTAGTGLIKDNDNTFSVNTDVIATVEALNVVSGVADAAQTAEEVSAAIDAKLTAENLSLSNAVKAIVEDDINNKLDSATYNTEKETFALKTYVETSLGGKVDNNTLNSYYTKTDIDDKGYAVAANIESTYATKDEVNEALALKAYADDVDELDATITEQAKAIEAIEEALALRAAADEVDELRANIADIIEDTQAVENKLIGIDGAVADYLSSITAAMASLEGRIDTLEDSLHFNTLCSAKTWDTSDSTKLKATCNGCGATGTIYVDNLDSLQKTYGNGDDLTSAVSVKKTGILRGFVKGTDYTVTCLDDGAEGEAYFTIKLSIADAETTYEVSYNIEKATSTPA